MSISYGKGLLTNWRKTRAFKKLKKKKFIAIIQQTVRQWTSCFVGRKQGFYRFLHAADASDGHWGLILPSLMRYSMHVAPTFLPPSSMPPSPHPTLHSLHTPLPFSPTTKLIAQPSPVEPQLHWKLVGWGPSCGWLDNRASLADTDGLEGWPGALAHWDLTAVCYSVVVLGWLVPSRAPSCFLSP